MKSMTLIWVGSEIDMEKLSKTNKELYQDFINKESYFNLNRDGNP